MSNQVHETVTVKAVSEKNNSFTDGTSWYNVSANAKVDGKPLTVSYFQKGQTYDVMVNTGPKGGKYVNGVANGASAPAVELPPKAEKAEEKPSEAYWATKNEAISKQGIYQAALQVAVNYSATEDQLVEKTMDIAKRSYKALYGKDWD